LKCGNERKNERKKKKVLNFKFKSKFLLIFV
jgi:hypothetical protein